MLTGVEQACRTNGYALAVVRTVTALADELQPAVDSLVEQGVEAIVLSERSRTRWTSSGCPTASRS